MTDEDFDYFYHYDSASAALDSGKLPIILPRDGVYWISLTNISLAFADDQVPDQHSGFLVVSETEERQKLSVSYTGQSAANKLIFPLTDPSSTKPLSKTYGKILLRTNDQFSVSYYDKNLSKLTMDRIVVSLHVSSSSDYIRYTTDK